MIAEVLHGCEPLSHQGDGRAGVVVVHGFTGNPGSVRGVADAMASAGFDVEMPRLPGHGTTIDDMLATGWADWYSETMQALDAAAARSNAVVAVGLSMGGTLALTAALDRADVDGVVVINPATRLRDAATMALLDEAIADGIAVVPGNGSDIADPDAVEVAYPGTPLVPLSSMFRDGVATLGRRLGEGEMPLLVMTSRQDHVIDPADSEFLVDQWAGPTEHVWLEQSYHVATRDYDRDLIAERCRRFVEAVAA